MIRLGACLGYVSEAADDEMQGLARIAHAAQHKHLQSSPPFLTIWAIPIFSLTASSPLQGNSYLNDIYSKDSISEEQFSDGMDTQERGSPEHLLAHEAACLAELGGRLERVGLAAHQERHQTARLIVRVQLHLLSHIVITVGCLEVKSS